MNDTKLEGLTVTPADKVVRELVKERVELHMTPLFQIWAKVWYNVCWDGISPESCGHESGLASRSGNGSQQFKACNRAEQFAGGRVFGRLLDRREK